MRAQWRDMAGRKTYVTGGARRAPLRRGVRRPLRAAARPLPTARVRGDRSVSGTGGCCSPPARRATPTCSSARSTTACSPGVALDGGGYFYVNPLHMRDGHREAVERGARRRPWFACACCPPNIMRLLASLQHYLATTRRRRRAAAPVRAGQRRLRARRASRSAWRPSTRGTAGSRSGRRGAGGAVDARPARPGAGPRARPQLDGEEHAPRPAATRALARAWRPGDTVDARAAMAPRLVGRTRASTPCAAASRSSAARSCTASRGATAPDGVRVDDLRARPRRAAARGRARADLLGGIVAVDAGRRRQRSCRRPATPVRRADAASAGRGHRRDDGRCPYARWGNRERRPDARLDPDRRVARPEGLDGSACQARHFVTRGAASLDPHVSANIALTGGAGRAARRRTDHGKEEIG